jgi:hypothetical protein
MVKNVGNFSVLPGFWAKAELQQIIVRCTLTMP